MKITKEPINYKNTVRDIFLFSKKYKEDIPKNLKSLKPIEYYKFVRNKTYIPDGFNSKNQALEILSRPKYLLENKSPSCDCDDKTVLLGAYFEANSIPWQIAVSGIGEPQHVFPIALIDGQVKVFDATYNDSKFDTYYPKNFNYLEIFPNE